MKIRTTIYVEEEVLVELDRKAKALKMPRSTLISRLAFSKLHNPDINNQSDVNSLDKKMDLILQKVNNCLKDKEHNPDIILQEITASLKNFRVEVGKNFKVIMDLLEDNLTPSKSNDSYVP